MATPEQFQGAADSTRPERDQFARRRPAAGAAVGIPDVPTVDPAHDAANRALADGGIDPITGEAVSKTPLLAEQTTEQKQLADDIDRKFQLYRGDRQPHEPQWYVSAAMLRGKHNLTWSSFTSGVVSVPVLSPDRQRRQINRIFAKVRARRAKFLKNRPTWVVVPATSDIKDKMDARATGKVLDFLWRKLRLEEKLKEAIIWAESCSRGYWWFSWNAEALGRVRQEPNPTDPTGKATVSEAVVGEVVVEVGSPFEVLPDNPAATSLKQVDELIRAKERTLQYVQSNFPDVAHLVKAEPAGDLFQYETQIAALNSMQEGVFGATLQDASNRKKNLKGEPNGVLVKEYFCRPNADYPKGRYVVTAAGIVLKEVDELPFGLWELENPFPCVEFVDTPGTGQYWGTTVIEQLIDLQREYNGVRTMISKQLRKMGHPKILVAKQHQLPEGAWNDEAGEIVEYNARPGIKEPFPWEAPNIVSDAWRLIELLRAEFDDITQIYPAAEGKSTGTESGFHANLLQEASDLVHGPDIRAHELIIEEAAVKIRKIVKQGYDIPRLITITSGSYQPEVIEFSSEDVDDYADIVVQAGSALPMLKGARIQAALDMYAKGVLGDPADPEVRKRVLNVLDMGGMEDIYDYNRVDEDMINIENSEAEDGMQLAQPRFFENHQAHYTGHINRLKSPATMSWPTQARMGLLAHAILHAMYINHAAAYQMSIEAGLPGLVPPPPMMGLPPGVVPPGGGPAGPGGAPGAPPGSPSTAGPSNPGQTFGEAPDQTQAAGTQSAS